MHGGIVDAWTNSLCWLFPEWRSSAPASFRAALPDPAGVGLWVRVTGTADGEYTCVLSLNPVNLAGSDDYVQAEGDLLIVAPADGVEKLHGATIDWREDPPRSGFVVVNPNKPPAPLALPVLPMSMPAGRGGRPAPQPPAAPSAPPGNLETDLASHGQPGETHIDPVNVRQKIAKDRERQQAHIYLAHRRFFDSGVHLFSP